MFRCYIWGMSDLIRRSPCEVYTKYLLVHPKQPNNEAIRQALESKGLCCLSDRYLDGLRALCRPPEQFFPRDSQHLSSVRFLKEHGIYELFHPTSEVRTALQFLDQPRVREAVEALVLSGAPDVSVSNLLGRRFGVSCTAGVIETYRWMFWNLDLVTRTELRALLDLPRIRAMGDSDPEVRAQADAMKYAGYMDARRLAADLPASPLASILAHARFGFMPPEMDYVHTLKQTQGIVAARLLETALIGGPRAGKLGAEWAATLQTVNAILEQVVRPEDEVRQHVERLALRAGKNSLVTLADLTKGEYNADYAALPENSGAGAIRAAASSTDEDLSSIGGEEDYDDDGGDDDDED